MLNPRLPGLTLLSLVLVAALAVVAVLAACDKGVGISYDSIIYVESARNLLAHHGLTAPERQYEASPSHEMAEKPLTHYPPLFPLLLAAVGEGGVDPAAGAAWLNALLLGATSLTIGIVVFGASGGSTAAALSAAVMVMAAQPMLRVHSLALSEPVFLFLCVLCLSLLSRYLERRGPLDLALAAACAALAWLDRYVGVAIVGTALLALLLSSRISLRRRLAECVAFGFLASAPTAAWLAWNKATNGTAAHRPLAWHPLTLEKMELTARDLVAWVVPEDLPRTLKILILALLLPGLAVLAATLLRRPRSADHRGALAGGIARVMLLFSAIYMAFLVAAISLFDAQSNVDARTLLPVYVCAVVVVSAWLASLHRASNARVRAVIVSVACLVLVASVLAAIQWTLATRDWGQAYTSRIWRESAVMQQIRRLPPETHLVSNNAAVIHYLTGRPARGVPVHMDPMSEHANPDYAREMLELRDFMAQDHSVLVFWKASGPTFLASEEEIQAQVNLRPVFSAKDGHIYEARR